MTSRLSLRPEAAADIAEAAAWYEDQRTGLGSEFTRAVRAQLAAIEREPRRYPIVRGEARRAVIRRFPYAIYFLLEPDAIVTFACLHHSRNPEIWQSRG
jgi:plasmid stabilization system protein ParE